MNEIFPQPDDSGPILPEYEPEEEDFAAILYRPCIDPRPQCSDKFPEEIGLGGVEAREFHLRGLENAHRTALDGLRTIHFDSTPWHADGADESVEAKAKPISKLYPSRAGWREAYVPTEASAAASEPARLRGK